MMIWLTHIISNSINSQNTYNSGFLYIDNTLPIANNKLTNKLAAYYLQRTIK